MSLARVADVGHVARVAVDYVLDLLQAAVGQMVVVESFSEIVVTFLFVAEVVAVIILDLVIVSIVGLLRFVRLVGPAGLVGILEGRKMYD